jgi:hypothetical protein
VFHRGHTGYAARASHGCARPMYAVLNPTVLGDAIARIGFELSLLAAGAETSAAWLGRHLCDSFAPEGETFPMLCPAARMRWRPSSEPLERPRALVAATCQRQEATTGRIEPSASQANLQRVLRSRGVVLREP